MKNILYKEYLDLMNMWLNGGVLNTAHCLHLIDRMERI